MGWKAISGTTLDWNNSGAISGVISGNAILESVMWPLTDIKKYKNLTIRLKNKSEASQMRIRVASYDKKKKGAFWSNDNVDWENEVEVVLDIQKNKDRFIDYTIDFSKLDGIKSFLKQFRIEPTLGVETGSWMIEKITIK